MRAGSMAQTPTHVVALSRIRKDGPETGGLGLYGVLEAKLLPREFGFREYELRT